ncbi:SusC/RagA family TonB-linked outer membrane protein [Flavisolibacter nicotianae]|uniref:SusC/RagA family TonB-linked outer membrane protein n=1 Tax=Flavisolibacter nicotianae TaxID=2364882 RepID=UPI000EB421CB|nr:TonB-dependent receptor [Flavisolibacter nicotianae]
MKQFYSFLLCFFVLLGPGSKTFAQQHPPAIKGRVKTETGDALPNVTVTVQNKTGDFSATSQTNAAGDFIINNVKPGETYTFTFTYVGYDKKVVTATASQQGETINLPVQLTTGENALSQVVVVGYGTQRKVNLTGAVDQVGSEYFEDRPLPNVARGLQGVIPNLNIKITDGKPTRSPSFNIRGVTSIGSGGSALVLIDGVPGDPGTVNPNDIESVSVLKDASSAAIYGARGSFGVVLITTKSAKKDKVQISYNTNYSINQRTFTPDLVNNGYLWAKNFDEAFYSWNDYLSHPQSINSQLEFSMAYLDSLKYHDEHPGLPQVTVNPATGKYQYYANTDWFRELYKDNNTSMEHSLSVSGGSDKINYLISGRYYHQDGIFRYNTDNFNRYNLRVKGSVKVTDWLTLNSNSDFSSYNYKYPLTSVGGVNAVWRLMAVTAFPVSPMLNPDGSMSIVGAYSIGDFYYGKSYSTTRQNFLRNTVGFNAAVIKNRLNLKGDFSFLYTNSSEQRRFFTVPYSIGPDKDITSGLNYLSNNGTTENYLVGNIYGEYNQSFGPHNVKLLGGLNLEKDQVKNLFAQRDGLLVDNLTDFNLATGQNYTLRGGGSEWATSGLFYRANYNFKSKYLLELNGRYDGSSKFPASQAFGFFPSASAGWKISEEHFMEPTRNWLDNLKLRASYGSLGNGNISPYTFMQTISSATSSVIMGGVFPSYFQQPAVVPTGLTWEKATTFDLGGDVELLKRKLKLTYDWYQRNTTGMITAGQPLPATFGASVPKGNNADLVTKGWELSLDWSDHIGRRKPFSYNLRVTLADNISHITRFYNPNKLLSTYYVGQQLGDIWGFQTEGFFTSQDEIAKHADQSYFVVSNANKLLPGDIKFADLNGDGKVNRGKNTLDDPGDQKIIGNSSIRFPYGVTGNMDWNNLSLSFFFQGVGKRDWFPSTEAAYFWGQYNRPYSFLPAFNLNRWTEDNPSQDAYFPRYRGYVALSGSRELAVAQTRYLQNASYVRLKNLTIGYTLPRSMMQKLKLSSVRVYLTGQNLWTYSRMFKITKNFDPEVIEGSDPEINGGGGDGFSYPMQKTYTLGASINF